MTTIVNTLKNDETREEADGHINSAVMFTQGGIGRFSCRALSVHLCIKLTISTYFRYPLTKGINHPKRPFLYEVHQAHS